MDTLPASSIANDSNQPGETNEGSPTRVDDYEPRVWFMSDGLCPLALDLSRKLLENGDYVVLGVLPDEFSGPRGTGLKELLANGSNEMENRSPSSSNDGQQSSRRFQLKVVPLDAR
jgi:hypothetical protein